MQSYISSPKSYLENFPYFTTISGFAALLLLSVYWCGTYRFAVLRNLRIAGPKPWPFLGNILELRKYGGMHAMLLANMKQYGKIFTVSFGRMPTLVIADTEVLKTILVKQFDSFSSRSDSAKPPPPIDSSLFAATGEQWKKIRSILSPSFTSGKMKQMVPLMEDAVEVLLTNLAKVADTGESVDVVDLFSHMTLDIILSTAFGIKTDIQRDPNNLVSKKAKRIFRRESPIPYLQILPLKSLMRRVLALVRRDISIFVEAAREIVEERKKQDVVARRKDLLQLILTAHDEPAVQGIRRLSDNELIAQLITFLLAGYQTSSSTLAFTAYHLALDADVQERLRLEVEIAIQTYRDLPLYDLVDEVEYLDCVIKESMRICPPVHSFNRKCERGCQVNSDLTIPTGMDITVPVYALHHDPDAWPDPEVYDPERFRGPVKETRHPYQFLPFGAGPRNCIGMKYAMMEMKVALARILRKYKFVRSPETQVPLILHAGVALVPRDGIHLQVKTVKSLTL